MPSSVEAITEAISESDDVAGFSCGEPALDEYLIRRALKNNLRGLSKTFVLRRRPHDPQELPAILGYYTLSMNSIKRDELGKEVPRDIRTNLPKQLPVALIGRMAIDSMAQKQGLGESLLIDAFQRVLAVEGGIGCYGIVVDAKSPAAVTFYLKYGFINLEPKAKFPQRLFITMETVRGAVE